LPAPFGPIRPTMRPCATVRSTPSRATVFPNVFLRPRTSIEVMRSRLPWCQQLFRRQAEPLDGRSDGGPLIAQELLPLGLQQQARGAGVGEHSEPPPLLHQ